MRNRSHLGLGVLILLLLSTAIAIGVREFLMSPVQRYLRDLKSRDIGRCREAQSRLAEMGKEALQPLLQRLADSTDMEEKGLIYSLIGEIDPGVYHKILLTEVDADNICSISRYFDSEVVRQLSPEQRKLLQEHMTELGTNVVGDAVDCAARIQRRLQGISQ